MVSDNRKRSAAATWLNWQGKRNVWSACVQKIHVVTLHPFSLLFPNVFYGLLTRWILETNPEFSGKVPSGTSVWLFVDVRAMNLSLKCNLRTLSSILSQIQLV